MPHRGDQCGEIVDATDENRTDQNPDPRREPTEERSGEDRTDDRSGRGNGRKMLRQQIRPLGWLEVQTVPVLMRRRPDLRIEREIGRQFSAQNAIREKEKDPGGK